MAAYRSSAPTPTTTSAPPILAGQFPLAIQVRRPLGRRSSEESPPSSATTPTNTAAITERNINATIYLSLWPVARRMVRVWRGAMGEILRVQVSGTIGINPCDYRHTSRESQVSDALWRRHSTPAVRRAPV